MSYSYMVPTVGIMPRGYHCRLDPVLSRVGQYLLPGRHKILWRVMVIHEGKTIHQVEHAVTFEDGKLTGDLPGPFEWTAEQSNWSEDVGFYESDFVAADGDAIIKNSLQPVSYVLFTAPGRKAFLSNRAYKFASPPTIDQIAAYGQFAEGFPSVFLDRRRDYGESIAVINPYRRPVLAKVITHDGRKIDRFRIPAQSARLMRLEPLLQPDENEWRGRLQITANNRVICFDVKHSLSMPDIIIDEEHLDPYRADPTHLPATRWARQWVGRWLDNRGWLRA